MVSTHPPARLGGDELHSHRHVCALFDGPADADATLLPFILEGFAEHERAVHLVDGRHRGEYLKMLDRAGLDTESVLGDGSLRVDTWEETYLRDRRFDPTKAVEVIRSILAEGRALGFARTRLIGFMEWALEDAPGVDRIIDYEARLQVALRLLPDIVVCVYDVGRQSQSVVLETIMTHPVALIGGVLHPAVGQTVAPRERILAAASELFTKQGVGATGVDTLIASAGVAKATFYRHFPSKDDLVVAWLRDPRTRWLDRLRVEAEAHATSPDEVIPAFFDAVVGWLETDGGRGCPYLDTAIEMSELAEPALAVIRAYLVEVEGYIRERLIAAGNPDADALAPKLQALLMGGMALSVAVGDTNPARAARAALTELLDETRAIPR